MANSTAYVNTLLPKDLAKIEIPNGMYSPGSVIQTKQVVSTQTDFSTSSTSFVAVTGVTASITPYKASSKILVMLNLSRLNEYADAYGLHFTVYRIVNGVAVDAHPTGGNRQVYFPIDTRGTGAQESTSMQFTFLDSPNTTNQVTYQFYGRSNNGGTVFLVDGTPPWFILQEIAQ